MALDLTPIALTQTLNLCFISGKIVQATSLGASETSAAMLRASLPLVLLAAGSLFAGMRLQSRISIETYRSLLRISLAGMAALLVLQVVWNLARR